MKIHNRKRQKVLRDLQPGDVFEFISGFRKGSIAFRTKSGFATLNEPDYCVDPNYQFDNVIVYPNAILFLEGDPRDD